jgi:hypothetical protein
LVVGVLIFLGGYGGGGGRLERVGVGVVEGGGAVEWAGCALGGTWIVAVTGAAVISHLGLSGCWEMGAFGFVLGGGVVFALSRGGRTFQRVEAVGLPVQPLDSAARGGVKVEGAEARARVGEVDVARAMAVGAMVTVHYLDGLVTVDSYASEVNKDLKDGPDEAAALALILSVGPYVAPLFLLLVGLSDRLSAASTPPSLRRASLRFAFIFALGLAVPLLRELDLYDVFEWDILPLVAVAGLLLRPLRSAPPPPPRPPRRRPHLRRPPPPRPRRLQLLLGRGL